MNRKKFSATTLIHITTRSTCILLLRLVSKRIMDLEPHNKLKRNLLDDIEAGEFSDSKRRCPLSKISTSENTDAISRALRIPEVISRIVKHLPAGCFINFRCVCKLWNEYFEPKFVFRDFLFQPKEIAALLLKSGCRRMKLEFQHFPVQLIPVNMWEQCYHKIRSLKFHCCKTSMDDLQSIISHCIALEELYYCRRYYKRHDTPVVQLLEYFIERKERRTRLRTLAVEDYQSIRISKFLEKTLAVFPYITDLRCTFEGICDDDEASGLACHRTYDLKKLRSYTIVSRKDYLWSENSVEPILDYRLLRLKKFKTVLHVEDFFTNLSKKGRLFQFFILQKDLEVIDLEIIWRNQGFEKYIAFLENFIKSLVFHVLKSCSKLQEFQLIGQYGSIKLTDEESEEFFSLISDLRSLKLWFAFDFEDDTSQTIMLPSSRPILSLSVLKMKISEPNFSFVIERSTQLHHLCINVYSDEQLRDLIVALPNLETLELHLYCGVTNYGFTGENEDTSIRRLQNLEYFHIMDHRGGISREIFDEFCFPRLKYLGLWLSNRTQLPETFSNMPVLKTLEVWLPPVHPLRPTEFVTDVCETLTNLNHLIIPALGFRDVSTAVEIFNMLPNLNLISCLRDNYTFIFNRNCQKAHCSRTRKLEFFENKIFDRIERYCY